MPSADARTPDLLHPLPDDARLWVFGSDRPLTGDEEALLLERVDHFLDGWKAHGRPLAARRWWAYGRFLLVGVDESVAPPTGCSIDARGRTLREVEEITGLHLLEKADIWFRHGGEIHQVSRASFRAVGSQGDVDGETIVFDPALTRVGELRAGKWERPAAQGWHGRLLPAPGAARGDSADD